MCSRHLPARQWKICAVRAVAISVPPRARTRVDIHVAEFGGTEAIGDGEGAGDEEGWLVSAPGELGLVVQHREAHLAGGDANATAMHVNTGGLQSERFRAELRRCGRRASTPGWVGAAALRGLDVRDHSSGTTSVKTRGAPTSRSIRPSPFRSALSMAVPSPSWRGSRSGEHGPGARIDDEEPRARADGDRRSVPHVPHTRRSIDERADLGRQAEGVRGRLPPAQREILTVRAVAVVGAPFAPRYCGPTLAKAAPLGEPRVSIG